MQRPLDKEGLPCVASASSFLSASEPGLAARRADECVCACARIVMRGIRSSARVCGIRDSSDEKVDACSDCAARNATRNEGGGVMQVIYLCIYLVIRFVVYLIIGQVLNQLIQRLKKRETVQFHILRAIEK